jgi:hypothetical protein
MVRFYGRFGREYCLYVLTRIRLSLRIYSRATCGSRAANRTPLDIKSFRLLLLWQDVLNPDNAEDGPNINNALLCNVTIRLFTYFISSLRCKFLAVAHTPGCKKKNLRGFGPLANDADRATAACWQVVPTFADIGCCVVSETDPPGR